MADPKYPNRYNAPDNEIEVDQTVRAANEADAESHDPSNSDESRESYRQQAEALTEHAKHLQEQRDEI